MNVEMFSRFLAFFQPQGVEERLQRLEGDKDSLQMQISILMDQIEVQTEKIAELEKNLADKNNQLHKTEDKLQKVFASIFASIRTTRQSSRLQTSNYESLTNSSQLDRRCFADRQPKLKSWSCSANFRGSSCAMPRWRRTTWRSELR